MIRTATSAYTVEVRPATIGDASALTAVLGRSFDTCPAWQWYLPPDSLAELYLRPGHECVTTADRTGAVPGGGPPVWRMWREPNDEQERA